MGNIVIVECH